MQVSFESDCDLKFAIVLSLNGLYENKIFTCFWSKFVAEIMKMLKHLSKIMKIHRAILFLENTLPARAAVK